MKRLLTLLFTCSLATSTTACSLLASLQESGDTSATTAEANETVTSMGEDLRVALVESGEFTSEEAQAIEDEAVATALALVAEVDSSGVIDSFSRSSARSARPMSTVDLSVVDISSSSDLASLFFYAAGTASISVLGQSSVLFSAFFEITAETVTLSVIALDPSGTDLQSLMETVASRAGTLIKALPQDQIEGAMLHFAHGLLNAAASTEAAALFAAVGDPVALLGAVGERLMDGMVQSVDLTSGAAALQEGYGAFLAGILERASDIGLAEDSADLTLLGAELIARGIAITITFDLDVSEVAEIYNQLTTHFGDAAANYGYQYSGPDLETKFKEELANNEVSEEDANVFGTAAGILPNYSFSSGSSFMISVSPNFKYTPSVGDRVKMAISRSNRNAFSDSARIDCSTLPISTTDLAALNEESSTLILNFSCTGASASDEIYVSIDVWNAADQITQSYRVPSSQARRTYPETSTAYSLSFFAAPGSSAGTGSSTGGGSPYGY